MSTSEILNQREIMAMCSPEENKTGRKDAAGWRE